MFNPTRPIARPMARPVPREASAPVVLVAVVLFVCAVLVWTAVCSN